MARELLQTVAILFFFARLTELQSAEREYVVSQSIRHSVAKAAGGGKLATSAKGDYCIVAREDCDLVSVFIPEQQGWREASRLNGEAIQSPSGLGLGQNSTALLLSLVARDLSVFKLKDGELRLLANASIGKADFVKQPRELVLHPSGRWFYFIADASNQVWAGALSAKDVPSFTQCFEGGTGKGPARTVGGVKVVDVPGIDFPRSPVVSPDGKDLYVACFKNHSVAHFRIHSATGALGFVGHTKTDETAKNYFAVRNGLTLPYSISVSIDGMLVVVGGAGKGAAVFLRNPDTGELTEGTSLLPDSAIGNIAAIRMSPDGKYMAVICRDENYVELFARTAVGKFTYFATLDNNTVSKPVMSRVSDVCFSGDSAKLFVTSDASLLATIELQSK